MWLAGVELAESCGPPGWCPLSSLACGLHCKPFEGLVAPTFSVVGFSGERDLAPLTPPSKQVFLKALSLLFEGGCCFS